MTDDLRQLLDLHAIQEVLARYCQAIDRLDRSLLASCFHPDSRHNHGFVGSSTDFIDSAWDVLTSCVATHHQLGNVSITVQGDFADVQSYFTAYHRLGNPPPAAFDAGAGGMDLTVGGRYIDRFERRDEVWRIVRRTGVHDWQRYEPASDRGFDELPADRRGRRDHSDPAYAAT